MAAQAPASVPSLKQSETGTPSRTPAPYGQACLNCVKAKCKCILIAATSTPKNGSRLPCERCTRLGRECKPSSGVRNRDATGSRRRAAGLAAARGSSSLSAASRTANLEQRLEDLMAVLKAQVPGASADLVSSQSSAEKPYEQERAAHNARPELGVPASLAIDQRLNNMATKPTSTRQPAITPASTASTDLSAPTPASMRADDVPMTASQAEEILTFFRQSYLKFFPFMYIPPGTDATQIQHERPFLWLAIRTVCCKSPVKQAALSQRILEQLGRNMLITCERNMDMLLGTLCTLGWAMHLNVKPILSALMGMAMSIVTDLRLDKPDNDPYISNCFKSNDFPVHASSVSRTMEERRATLACYVCCSSGSSLLRCQSMRWTAHMEDSLKILANNPECESDHILILMARIQKLIENIVQAHATWDLERDTNAPLKPSVNVYIKYFLQSLQTIRDQTPESLWDNRLATSLIMSAEVYIMDIPFYNPAHPVYLMESHARPGAQAPPRDVDIGRIEASFAVLQSSAAFLKHFLTFGLSDLVGLSIHVILNFGRALQVPFRLRVLDHPGWDPSVITDSIDMFTFNNVIANRYSQLSGLYGFLTERDADGNEVSNFYIKHSKMLRATLSVWRPHATQGESLKASTGTTLGGDNYNAGTRPQAPPAMINDGLYQSLQTREDYPAIHSNVALPESFPIDFSLDDAWYTEVLFSSDPTILGPGQ
ncbi:hypothetical protein F4861DRAFT_431606 [Xylaria intraflava]|nr:hypothetical protein F4861DRAFT_431606 [Xylaria intraflava]